MIDDEVALIGSFNLDPHSANINTEAMIAIFDADFCRALTASIERDIAPQNSWVVWRLDRPLGVEQAFSLVETVNALGAAVTGVDLWPSMSTSAFELIAGETPVPVTTRTSIDATARSGTSPGWRPAIRSSSSRGCSRPCSRSRCARSCDGRAGAPGRSRA